MKRKRGEPSRITIALNFSLHGMLWGTLLGVLLGAAYGAVVSLPTFADTTDTIAGHLVFCVIGLVVGGIIGAIAGCSSGLIMGAGMGIMTLLIFNSLLSLHLYRRIMIALASATTFLGAITLFGYFYVPPIPIRFHIEEWMYFFIPAIIAIVASVYASNKIVDWWLEEIGEKQKKKRGTA